MDSIMGLNPYQKDKGIMGLVSCFVAAQVAGICARPFNYPFDTVRRRLQMESEKPMDQRIYKGTVDCGVKILRDEGFSGMYKGALANIFRGVGASLVLVLYGEIKNALARQKEE